MSSECKARREGGREGRKGREGKGGMLGAWWVAVCDCGCLFARLSVVL